MGKVAAQPRHRYGSAVESAQPKEIVVQHRGPRHAAKAVREPRPTRSLLSSICRLVLRSSLTWRNWQTRTAQDRMGKPVEVRVLS